MRSRLFTACLSLALGPAALAAQGTTAAISQPPSDGVDPAIAAVRQSLATISIDRWKVTRPVRDTLAGNLESITRDIRDTLPSLLSGADATPTSTVAILPLTQNLTALYEVLLRVTVVAESFAPKEQASSLEQALTRLQAARHSLEERAQTVAASQDVQIADLHKAFAAATASHAAAPVPAVVPPPCQQSRKKKR